MPKRPPVSTSFKPGQSGNPKGREKGSRNKLGEHFIKELYAHWQQHGVSVLDRVQHDDPSTYLKVVASLLPKETHHTHFLDDLKELSTEELKRKLALIRKEREMLENANSSVTH
jgi:hypothetical protein